jgi:hypothetical protein
MYVAFNLIVRHKAAVKANLVSILSIEPKYAWEIVTDHYFPASFSNIMSYYRIIMSRTYYQFWIKSDLSYK